VQGGGRDLVRGAQQFGQDDDPIVGAALEADRGPGRRRRRRNAPRATTSAAAASRGEAGAGARTARPSVGSGAAVRGAAGRGARRAAARRRAPHVGASPGRTPLRRRAASRAASWAAAAARGEVPGDVAGAGAGDDVLDGGAALARQALQEPAVALEGGLVVGVEFEPLDADGRAVGGGRREGVTPPTSARSSWISYLPSSRGTSSRREPAQPPWPSAAGRGAWRGWPAVGSGPPRAAAPLRSCAAASRPHGQLPLALGHRLGDEVGDRARCSRRPRPSRRRAAPACRRSSRPSGARAATASTACQCSSIMASARS
jgi:hypothetical protein